MSRLISGSVGINGTNREPDVITVQTLLNLIPADEGGPKEPLAVDGKSGERTESAIHHFQLHHFGWSDSTDGRVDPAGRTLTQLHEFDKGEPDQLSPPAADPAAAAGVAVPGLEFGASDAARSVAVVFVNATDERLKLLHRQLAHGVWSAGLEPPAVIEPRTTARWQSESEGIATGTEGSATYDIGAGGTDQGQVNVRWNNPFWGPNKYGWNLLGGGSWSVWREGGEGNNARASFTLSGDRLGASAFDPNVHGFAFGNTFPTAHFDLITIGDLSFGLFDASNGLCGGMVFAARDYFEAGRPSPKQYTAQSPPSGPGDPLFDYLVARLWHSIDIPWLPVRCLALMNPDYPDRVRSSAMIQEAWPAIRAGIDAGVPVPICAVTVQTHDVTKLGKNHQVLVTAYHLWGKTLILSYYDPNYPGGTHTMTLDIDRPEGTTAVSATSGMLQPVYSFFPTAYSWSDPPAL